jgi:hypothetical protein
LVQGAMKRPNIRGTRAFPIWLKKECSMFELLFGLVILALDVYAIVKVLGSPVSGGAKALWVIGIVLFPLLGFIVWLIAGPKRVSASQA